MKKFLLAASIAALACASANAATFNFSEQLDVGPLVTGSFDGTLNGNLITNLSNISVALDGVAFNGPLYGSSFDGWDWVSGGAVASLDGTQNNFLFIDADYPTVWNYTNYYLSINGGQATNAWNGNTGQGGGNYAVTHFSATLASPAPEPASWALMVGGFGAIGGALRSRRKAAVSFA
jgi:hypothetical protein